MISILLFIPFYNCEKQLPRVLSKVNKYNSYFSEILLVDNLSTDNSLAVAVREIHGLNLKRMTLIRNQKNYNLGGSHKVAFKYAKERNHSHVIVLHGDDQGSVEDLIELIDSNQFLQYDCLLGSRFVSGSKLLGYSKFRTMGNIVLNFLCSIACKKSVKDMGSGLNMYSSAFFTNSKIETFPNDLTFNVYLLFHSYLTKAKIKFFPLTWREEDQISNAKLFKQFKKIVRLVVIYMIRPQYIYHDGKSSTYNYELITQT